MSWLSGRKAPTVASCFSGCGGLDLGAQIAGFRVVFGNDLDSDSALSFKGLFKKATFAECGIQEVDKIPEADVLTGGYPCQSFSMGGKRAPSADSRSDLYKEFARIIGVVNPKVFVAENVVGLLALDGGSHFRRQIRALRQAGEGYRISWQRIDAAQFGVPQHRKRVLIVGVRRDLDRRFVFPAPTHGAGLLPFTSHGAAIAHLPLWPEGEFYERTAGGSDNFPWYYMSRNRKAPWHSPSFTIVANWRHVSIHPASPMMQLTWSNLKDGFKQRWDFAEEYEHCPEEFGRPRLDRPRRLSWRESSIIQTFPEEFVPAGSTESKYRQVGNAVPPLLSAKIFEAIASEASWRADRR